MKTDTIPETAVPLGPEQANAMRQRRVTKHHVAIILLHWFNATTWIAELTTGAALIVSRHFRFAPAWYLDLVDGVFGTRGNMLRFHVALGLLWIGVFLVYGIFGFRTYLGREVIQREMGMDADDWRWLRVRVLRILGRSNEPLPPQGAYNAGQKMFGWLVYTMVPLVMLSGLVMVLRLAGPGLVGWAVTLHFAAAGAVASGLMIHLYMGAVFPEEKPAFFSMFTSSVDEWYAYNHHFKWWRQVKLEEQAWLKRHEQAKPVDRSVGTSPATATPEDGVREGA